jgi:hypothetical protein
VDMATTAGTEAMVTTGIMGITVTTTDIGGTATGTHRRITLHPGTCIGRTRCTHPTIRRRSTIRPTACTSAGETSALELAGSSFE